jgi:hypothetical protein
VTMQCMPPPKPAVVRKAPTKAKPPACVLQAAPASGTVAPAAASATPVQTSTPAGPSVNVSYGGTPVNQQVKVYVVRGEEQQGLRRAQQPVYVQRAPVKSYTLYVFGGASPTRYTVSDTACTGITGPSPTCSAEIKRKWVPDFGLGAQAKVTPSVSVGVLGTVQGAFYGSLGFSF